MSASTSPITERGFYLSEFRGRTLGFAVSPAGTSAVAPLGSVFEALRKNGTRVIVMSPDPEPASRLGLSSLAAADVDAWPAQLWRQLGVDGAAGLALGGGAFEPAVKSAALRLGLSKLVWLRDEGGLRDEAGIPISFIDRKELRRRRQVGTGSSADVGLLAEIESMLEGGIPSINLCSAAGLDDELFTYAGSGTLFTRERYVEVRALSVDDFDAAGDLISRGVAEGYLVDRDEAGLDRVLSGGIGVFVEGRDLAGVGSLLPHADVSAAEIASLYTVTRYLGEGIGHQIVSFAVRRALEAGYVYVFACTTSDRVAAFFERAGFRRVGGDEIPPAKWDGYPRERRDRLICMRSDLD